MNYKKIKQQKLVLLFECGGVESLQDNTIATNFISQKRWIIAALIFLSGGYQPSLGCQHFLFALYGFLDI